MGRILLRATLVSLVVLGGLSAPPASASMMKGQQAVAPEVPSRGTAASAEARRKGKAVPVPADSAPGRTVVANPDGTFTAKFSLQQQPGYPASYPRIGWSMVFEGKPDQNGWNGGTDTDGVAKVGECYPSAACNGIRTARSYFRYDTSFLNGRQVTRAKLMTHEVYAPSCSPRPVNLHATADFGPGDTYRTLDARRGGWIYMDQRNVAHGYSGNCGASDVEFDALTRFTLPGLENRNSTAFVLTAADENDGLAWKKFRTDPSLNVTYNSPPDRPDYLVAEGAPCTTTGESWVNPNRDVSAPARGPILSAKAWDVDTGSQTQVEFQWKQRSEPDSAIKTAYTQFQGGWSLATLTAPLPSAGTETGKRLHYRARSFDGGAWSTLTNWCNVSIDRTMPAPPAAIEPVEKTTPAKAGLPKMFRFMSAASLPGEAPLKGFLWGTHAHGRSFAEVRPDGSALVPVTMIAGGPAKLYVRTVDAAGNESDQITLDYQVQAGNPAKGYWPLDGLAETQARDYGTAGNHVPVDTAKVGFRAGRHGDGLRFASTPSAVQTQRQVLDPTKPFTVAAWAKLEQTGASAAVVSQDGRVTSAFQLLATADNRWSFAMFDSNVVGGAPTRAVSPTTITLNTWTHLAGAWDPEAKEVQLYVNGLLSDVKTRAANSPSDAGPLAIGRSRWDSTPREFWPGTIDEVYAFDRRLPPNEIADLATGPATEELFLPLEEMQRTADPAVDMSGWYRRVTGSNVVFDSTVRPLGDAKGSAKFTGSTGSGLTTPAVVRTDNSFTVTARVRLGEGATGVRTVLSQSGTNNHGFALRHDAARGWVFSMSRTDAPGAAAVEVAAPATTGWTYLAGVYNAATNSISLYVGAELKATAAFGGQPWHAAGALTIGRGTKSGAPVEPWLGWIADVHAWSGVRSGQQIESESIRTYTIRDRAAENPFSGQLSRYNSYDGYHVITTGAVPSTTTFEEPLGQLAPESTTEPTAELYSCRSHSKDYFLAIEPNCTEAGITHQFLGRLGKLYRAAPTDRPTTPLYRCRLDGRGHYVSRHQDCEGVTGAVNEGRLGYALDYGNLVGARRAGVGDRATAAAGLPTDFQAQQQLGLIPMQPVNGLMSLYLCARTKNGAEDFYLSTAADCERSSDATARLVIAAGGVFPEDFPGVTPEMTMLWRCEATTGDRFESADYTCGDVGTIGEAVPLGWISTFLR